MKTNNWGRHYVIAILAIVGSVLLSENALSAIQDRPDKSSPANLSATETAVLDSLIMDYFEYLFSGNLIGLRSIATGNLLAEIEGLAANPNYPNFLRKYYRNADYEIVEYRISNTGQLIAVVAVVMGDGSSISFRFFLQGNTQAAISGKQIMIESVERQ